MSVYKAFLRFCDLCARKFSRSPCYDCFAYPTRRSTSALVGAGEPLPKAKQSSMMYTVNLAYTNILGQEQFTTNLIIISQILGFVKSFELFYFFY